MTARLALAACACFALRAAAGPPERFAFVAKTERGVYDCARASGASGSETLFGEVTRADADTLQLDLCAPTADCNAPRLATVTVRAAGVQLDRWATRGTYVRVELELVREGGGACRQRLLVASVDRWMGDANRGSRFFFAGHEAAEPFADAPFRRAPGRCADALALASTSASGGRLQLTVARTVEGDVSGERWAARLLRCDGDRASYWVAGRR
jgi:hypothetical protein